MLNATLVRLLCAVLICGASVAAYRIVSAAVLRKARRGAGSLSLLSPGVPGIVYFTTKDCATCKAAQRPALRTLEERMEGRIQVVEVDAGERPDLARQWSVLSVPTTFILDGAGRPRQINHGFASARKLQGQLESVMEKAG